MVKKKGRKFTPLDTSQPGAGASSESQQEQVSQSRPGTSATAVQPEVKEQPQLQSQQLESGQGQQSKKKKGRKFVALDPSKLLSGSVEQPQQTVQQPQLAPKHPQERPPTEKPAQKGRQPIGSQEQPQQQQQLGGARKDPQEHPPTEKPAQKDRQPIGSQEQAQQQQQQQQQLGGARKDSQESPPTEKPAQKGRQPIGGQEQSQKVAPLQQQQGKPQKIPQKPKSAPQKSALQQQPQGEPQKPKSAPQQSVQAQKGPRQQPPHEGPPKQGPKQPPQKSREPQQGQGDINLVSQTAFPPGTKGRKIKIETNHLELKLGSLKTAYHYDVNLVPDTPKRFLRQVVEAFRLKHLPNVYFAFDGRKNIYASKPLSKNLNDLLSDEIKIQDEENRPKSYMVEIKFANEVDLTPLHNLLQQRATPQEALQCVDVVLRSAPAAQCISVGRSFFVQPRGIINLGQGMEMYHGFYQSAIRGWKPLLNVDVAHKAFPKNIPVIDALVEVLDTNFRQKFTRDNLSRPLDRFQEETFSKFIKMLRVRYEIPGNPASQRMYRVNGLGQDPNRKEFTHEGRKMTIVDYFAKVKNFRLRYPHLPTLWVGNVQRTDKILLPLELCFIVEGQAVNRKMNETQTSNMIKQAATSSTVRKEKIMQGLERSNYNAHPCVREFGFSVASEFEKLDARVLDPPSLTYSRDRKVMPRMGVWRNDKFLIPVTINKWTIVNVNRYPPRGDDLPRMAQTLQRSAGDCGMQITSPPDQPFENIGGRQSLADMEAYFKKQIDKKYDVIFVVVPDSGPQYGYVKRAAEIVVGCLTQCIKTKTLGRMNQQTAVNILLKVNSKLNGKNHSLTNRPLIMNRPCMIMGADVTHPSPDSTNIPSVAAVTASHDPLAFQYNICWRLQPPRTEIISDLENIMIEQLKFFYQKTKSKPERIVFFRDGVSEGQFQQVRDAEIRAIRAACKRLQQDGYEPRITFLVVQKRHHTRLFPLDPKDSQDKNINVPAGTCVDHTITHRFMQDFYLVSHASIQGVARPTKYCTIHDDNKIDNDNLEELTYHLCHLFTRCNRSVSYPAPTYYAHLAAARAKVYIENEENLDMDNLQTVYNRFQIKNEIRKELPMFFV